MLVTNVRTEPYREPVVCRFNCTTHVQKRASHIRMPDKSRLRGHPEVTISLNVGIARVEGSRIISPQLRCMKRSSKTGFARLFSDELTPRYFWIKSIPPVQQWGTCMWQLIVAESRI